MSRCRRVAVLLPALGLLIAVWWLLTPARVPLYDGVQFPSYRYLHTPPDQPNNGPPYPAHVVIPILAGASPITKIHTADPDTPQAYLVLKYRALRLTAATRRVMLTIKAVDPPAGPPKHRVIDGNVYRFAAVTASGKPVAVRPGFVLVELAGTGASGTATLARYSAGHWASLPTVAISSQGYYAARVPALGDFTLILAPRKTSVLAEALPFIIAGVLVVLLLAVGIFLIRSGRTRETRAP